MTAGDNELALQAAHGDAAAFRLLLERHYDLIFRVGLRFLGLREDAEDLAQEVCAALPKKLRTYEGSARFTTWLYRVVANAARDMQRKQATGKRTAETWGELSALERDEAKQAEAEIEWLYETLDQVPDDLRQTAILVLAEDMTHAQAADVLGIKESTVSWRMHELKKQLKTLADKDE